EFDGDLVGCCANVWDDPLYHIEYRSVGSTVFVCAGTAESTLVNHRRFKHPLSRVRSTGPIHCSLLERRARKSIGQIVEPYVCYVDGEASLREGRTQQQDSTSLDEFRCPLTRRNPNCRRGSRAVVLR